VTRTPKTPPTALRRPNSSARSAPQLARGAAEAAYQRFDIRWQLYAPAGQIYSLFFHTRAMRLWLAGSGVTKQQAADFLESEFRP
jgi:hypothetical protein